MKIPFKRSLAPAAAILAALSLGGCYAYPVGYAQGGYYAPTAAGETVAVAPAPVVVEPGPIVVPFGFYGGGYRGGYGGYRGGYGWRR